MPVIKVWCLPKENEEMLQTLHKAIVKNVTLITELGLRGEQDMTVLFPPDQMKYGLGSEIVIEILLFKKPERTTEVLNRLAEKVGTIFYFWYKDAKIEVFVQTCDPTRGFWTSAT